MKWIEAVGRRVLQWCETLGAVWRLASEAGYWLVVGPFRGKPVRAEPIFTQTVFAGCESVGIVMLVAGFTGVVMAMQGAYQLEQFGSTLYVASLVSVSMVRELGPVLISLVIAGRVGSAMTAELGTMKVTEQIDALDILALNPVRLLVVPRLVAMLVMLPCLVIIGDVAGLLGGLVVGVGLLETPPGLFLQTAFRYLERLDVISGFVKSVVFALLIAVIACYHGLKTAGGAEGVGRATTVSVVASFIAVIVADCVLTALFYFTGV